MREMSSNTSVIPVNTKDQLNSRAESTSHSNEKEKEMACLHMREETNLWLFSFSDYLLENQSSSSSAYPFPKKGVLLHTISKDESTKYKKMNKNKIYKEKYGICLCTWE